jgi:hypothetical protein
MLSGSSSCVQCLFIVILHKSLLRVAQDRANQFNHAAGNAKEKSDNADPACVQPTVEGGAEEPSGNGSRRKHQSELAVAADLDPGIVFGIGWTRIVRRGHADPQILRQAVVGMPVEGAAESEVHGSFASLRMTEQQINRQLADDKASKLGD